MYLTHFFKHLAALAATPLACAFLITLGGLIVRLFGRRRIATVLWSAAAILLYVAAIGPVADALLEPLEVRYPPLGVDQILPAVPYIVVLGSDYAPRDGIPITAALSGDALARIAEGVRLMRTLHGARLVVSGGALPDRTPSAIGYSVFAVDFGVDPAEIIKLDQSLDTADEARSVSAVVGQSPFILVTSAYHMPRAMRLMQRAGAHPIAAPTGQLAPRHSYFGVQAWIPSVGSLRKSDRALHEYLGLAIVN
jgi:uncharacterized SAM-binding protein YcdF (DUF218 family)